MESEFPLLDDLFPLAEFEQFVYNAFPNKRDNLGPHSMTTPPDSTFRATRTKRCKAT